MIYGHALMRWKLIIEFKHIRFKSYKSSPKLTTPKDACEIRLKKLSEILECSVNTARGIILQDKNILALDSQTFHRNVGFCKQHLKLSDIVHFPFVLSLNSSLLQHRYFTLQELGCSCVTANCIIKFPYFIKMSPAALQKENLHFSIDRQPAYCMDILEQSVKDEVRLRLQQMYDDGSSLWKIKEAMNAEFLSAKLGCSLGRAHQLLHRYPPLRLQSIVNTNNLLNVLFHKCGFSASKVCGLPSLLSIHYEIIEHFLAEVPNILGVNTINIVSRIPLVLKRPIESVKEVAYILQHFNISDKQLLCCPRVVNFAPVTLQQRLESLCSSEDFAALKPYKKFLWLVYYYNNLSSRLEALKAVDMACSISMFVVSKENFNKYLLFSKCRTLIDDTCFYLAHYFGCSEKEILLKLREYPNFQNCSLSNSQKIIEFLENSGVSKPQILNGVGIIFYDLSVVKLYFNDLKNRPECQPFTEWMPHYNLIQLLIYAIEVDIGFKGSRFYKVGSSLDESEQLAISSHGV